MALCWGIQKIEFSHDKPAKFWWWSEINYCYTDEPDHNTLIYKGKRKDAILWFAEVIERHGWNPEVYRLKIW